MVSVLDSSAVGRGFEPGRVKPKTIKLVLLAKHAALRRKSKDWLARNRIMCLSAAFLYADCCFSELALLESN